MNRTQHEMRRGAMAILDRPLNAREESLLLEAYAIQRRMALISDWVRDGYIEVVKIRELNDYRVECAGAVFREATYKFPTEELIAKLGLAINSGAITEEMRAAIKRRRYDEMKGVAPWQRHNEYSPPRGWQDDVEEIKEDVFKSIRDMIETIGKEQK